MEKAAPEEVEEMVIEIIGDHFDLPSPSSDRTIRWLCAIRTMKRPLSTPQKKSLWFIDGSDCKKYTGVAMDDLQKIAFDADALF